MDVIGFGPLDVEKIMHVDKIPSGSEESFLKYKDSFPGGSAANTIAALAKLQVSTGFIGKIGSDPEGSMLIEDMMNHGVDARGIKLCDGRSGVSMIISAENGERICLSDPGVNDDIDTRDVPLAYLEKARFLHMSPFSCRLSKKSFETQRKLAREAGRMGVRVSLDPGTAYAKMPHDDIRDFLRASSVMFLDESEVRMLTGKDCKEGAIELIETGAETVAVKLGAKGCFARSGTEEVEVPAFGVKAVDCTGCGDAFNAGFLFGMLRKKSLEECAKLGNAEAAFCIRCRGARSSLPTKEELLRIVFPNNGNACY
jgi:ribokinase